MKIVLRLLAACVGAIGILAGCARPAGSPLQHEAYIWQRARTPGLFEAMSQSGRYLAGWHVLLAESDARGDWQVFAPGPSDLSQGARPLTAVVRLDGTRGLADADTVKARVTTLLTRQPAGQWTGLEIDYDCPSRDLPQYASFLRELRAALPAGITLSVTALPTWIPARGLKAVLSETDESVLQVHSVLDPRRGLFDGGLAGKWIAAYAKRTDKPFRVALPDYGSRVAWDSSCHLLSVLSEQPGVQMGADQEELEARPQDIGTFLAKLRAAHPRNLVGVIWFRLPVAGDRRIWSLPTLESVIRGDSLDIHESIQVVPDEYGAYRILLTNVGRIDTPLPRTVSTDACVAADGMDGYSVQHERKRLAFARREPVMLRAGQSVAIGWTRCLPNEKEILLED